MKRLQRRGVTHKFIAVGNIEVHPTVQRPFQESNSKKLVADFSPDSFEDLCVTENPNKKDSYYVFVGQHRRAAAHEMYGSDFEVPCKVYNGFTEEQLAKIQYDLSVGPKSWNAIDAFGLKVKKGEIAALEIKGVVEANGLHVDATKNRGAVWAVSALQSVYSRDGKTGLNRTLKILHEAWNRDPDAYQSNIIRGVGMLVHRYNGEMDDSNMVTVMKKQTDAAGLLGRARSASKINSVSVAASVAELLAKAYNSKKKNKLPSFR